MSSLSNLPAGVTSREIDALCDHFADNCEVLFDCSRCLQSIYDFTEISHHRVNGHDVCGECVNTCAMCGQWLNDDDLPAKVIEVRFSEWENDGKLSDAHCPQCAANWLIGGFIGDKTFDYDDYDGDDGIGRLEITYLLYAENSLPSQWSEIPSKQVTNTMPSKEETDAA